MNAFLLQQVKADLYKGQLFCIEEAVTLGTHVIVLSPRPEKILEALYRLRETEAVQ